MQQNNQLSQSNNFIFKQKFNMQNLLLQCNSMLNTPLTYISTHAISDFTDILVHVYKKCYNIDF